MLYVALGVIVISGRTAAVVALAALAACAPERKSPPQFSNWAELCAKTDCEQFPIGYRTEQVGGRYFYLPIPSGDRNTRNIRGLYVERNEQGAIKRAAQLDPRNRRIEFYDFRAHSERFGLPPPPQPGYRTPGRITYYEMQTLASGIPGQFRSSSSFVSIEHVKALNLPSFDQTFWLVYRGDGSLYRDGQRHDLVLISKTPLLFGRHVWVDCTTFCDVETVTFSTDPQAGYPSVKIDGLSKFARWPGGALEPGPCDSCMAGAEPFAVLPDTLRWIEQVLERLKEKPQSR